MHGLPYANINLRFNPFGELNPDERQQLACVDVSGLAQYLSAPRTAVQFLADHGRGKTTLISVTQTVYDVPLYQTASR